MNSTFKVVFNKVRGALMVVNEVTSSVQSGKTAAVTVAAIGAMAAGSALAADLGHFTEADSGKTFVVESYLGNNLGRWDGRDITLDGQTDVTIQSSGMTFGKVIGKDATINFVNDRADGMSTGLLIDGKIDPVHTYSTGPMTVKVKKMTVTNNIADDSQYGIWAQNTDKSGVNLSVDAETVEITAINHAVSLHSGAVAEFKNIKSLTATADRNAFRAVGGSSITLDAVDGAQIALIGGKKGDGICVYDSDSTITINNANGTNSVSSVSNKGNLTVLGETTVNGNFVNENKFVGSNLTVKGDFKNSQKADFHVKALTISHPAWAGASSYELQGTIKADEKIVFNVGTFEAVEIGAALSTKKLEIQSGTAPTAPIIASNDALSNVGEILIQTESVKTGLIVKEGVDVDFGKPLTMAGEGDARIQIREDASFTVDTLTSSAKNAKLQIDNPSGSLTARTIDVQKGSMNLEVLKQVVKTRAASASSAEQATFNLGTVNVADGARFSASVYDDAQPDIKINGIDGNLNINLGSNAVADLGGVKNNNWRSDKIQINADAITVSVNDLENPGNVFLTEQGTDLTKTTVKVVADGSLNSGDSKADLEKLAGVVALTSNTGDKDESGADVPAAKKEAAGTKLEIGEGMYGGAASAVVGSDGALSEVAVKTNSVMSNVLDLTSGVTLSVNRMLMNDVRKRMGDLRSSAGTHGFWARYDGGRLSGDHSFKNDFSTIQVGADTVPVPDAPRFGVAFAYTTSDADMNRGSADMDAFSLAFYGTKMYDNGAFFDVIARMASVDADVTIDGNKKGAMDNVAVSLSSELGWRFEVTDQFYVEPQAEVTYTYVNSENLKLSDGTSYKFDSVTSLIGRAGMAVGFKCPKNLGDVYIRASAVHEFMGDETVRGGVSKYEIDGKKTWIEYGLGANFNVNDNTYVWADVERTDGGLFDEDWRATVGVRFAF